MSSCFILGQINLLIFHYFCKIMNKSSVLYVYIKCLGLQGGKNMADYTLTVFSKSGEKLMDETFTANNDAEAKKLGNEKLKEENYSEHRSEEHTSELQSRFDLVCRLLLEKKKYRYTTQ